MTNEEAIKIIKQFRDRQGNSSDDNEALDKAIKALEQQPCEDVVSIGVFEQVKWERDVAIEQLEQLGYSLGEKIRTSEDYISRAEAINVVHKYFMDYLKLNDDICLDGIRSLPSVTPTIFQMEQVEDCISRESLRQKLQEHHDFFVNAYGSFKDMTFKEKARVDEINNCIAMVVNAPSVTPSRLKGKWIDDNCSICGYGVKPWNNTPYCPNCGADMRESEVNADGKTEDT